MHAVPSRQQALKYLTIDAIISIYLYQIENKVESEKHVKVRFFTLRTDPTLRFGSNIGWGLSEQCWIYQRVCIVIAYFCTFHPGVTHTSVLVVRVSW